MKLTEIYNLMDYANIIKQSPINLFSNIYHYDINVTDVTCINKNGSHATAHLNSNNNYDCILPKLNNSEDYLTLITDGDSVSFNDKNQI